MNTVINTIALVPAGQLLTIGDVAHDQQVTDSYNAIANALNTEVKAGDFIRSDWVRVVPAISLAEMAVSRIKAGLPLPPILAKAVSADKSTKKLLVIARKERKGYLVKTQRSRINAIMDAGFNVSKEDLSKAVKPDGKGNLHIDIRLTKGAKPEVTEEDKKAVLGSLTKAELLKLLAEKETAENTTDVVCIPAAE